MTSAAPTPSRLFRSVWVVDRARVRLLGGHRALGRPRPDRWGTMRLTTVGRHTGRERSAILGYVEDGPNLVALSVNGWAEHEPAWWLNLQAQPDAVVELGDGVHPVRAREAQGDERARLWAGWRDLGNRSGEPMMADLDRHAAPLARQVAVVVLEPRAGPGA